METTTNTTNNTNLSTAAASSSVALSVVVLIQWLLSAKGITMPADVAAAISVLITAVAHYLIAIKIVPVPSTTTTTVTPSVDPSTPKT